MPLKVSISSVEWCFLHDIGEKSTEKKFLIFIPNFPAFPYLIINTPYINNPKQVSFYSPSLFFAKIDSYSLMSFSLRKITFLFSKLLNWGKSVN